MSIGRECPSESAGVVELQCQQTCWCTCGSLKQVQGIAAILLHPLAWASLLPLPPCYYLATFFLWRRCAQGMSPVPFQSDTCFLWVSVLPLSIVGMLAPDGSSAAPCSLSGSERHQCRWWQMAVLASPHSWVSGMCWVPHISQRASLWTGTTPFQDQVRMLSSLGPLGPLVLANTHTEVKTVAPDKQSWTSSIREVGKYPFLSSCLLRGSPHTVGSSSWCRLQVQDTCCCFQQWSHQYIIHLLLNFLLIVCWYLSGWNCCWRPHGVYLMTDQLGQPRGLDKSISCLSHCLFKARLDKSQKFSICELIENRYYTLVCLIWSWFFQRCHDAHLLSPLSLPFPYCL